MKLLGVTDLAKRWNYTRQGVHQKMQKDNNFPKPVSIINNRILVFTEEEIAEYEKSRREFFEEDYKRRYVYTGGRTKY